MNNIRNAIRAELDRRQWSVRKLAREADLSNNVVGHYLRTGRAEAGTIDKLLSALGLTAFATSGKIDNA